MSKLSIDDVLELKPKEFMEFLDPMTYQDLRNIRVLLEIEFERSMILYGKYKGEGNTEKMVKMNINSTIINERIGVCNYMCSKRGVDLSIFKS